MTSPGADRTDAVGRLAAALDLIDSHVQIVDETARREQTNRLSLLHLHAGFAMYIAPAFASLDAQGMQSPTFTVIRAIPGAPFTLAAVLFTGGLILGIATWHRALWWEMVGLWMLFGWYLTMGASFAAAVLLWLGAGRPDPRPSLYAHGVYLHVGSFIAVHLWTLIRMRRARKTQT